MTEAAIERRGPGLIEFVALMAFLSALDALSIDAMLPALAAIGADLGVDGSNQPQLIVTLFFLGMAFGQMLGGPLSDSFGRKPALYLFLAIYAAGAVLAMLAGSFPVMLAGRIVQGFGAAGPFVITMALIRDLYRGEAMARISSFVMTVFILVPMIAPLLGQAILLAFSWRAIFAMFVLLCAIVTVWLALRQTETLAKADRKPFELAVLWQALHETCTNRQALGYTIVEGLLFGAFLGYLSTAPQIFKDIYGVEARFPLYFAGLAAVIGAASLVNGSLVMRLGMRRLTAIGLAMLWLAAIVFLILALAMSGRPPFWILLAYLAVTLFCAGLLFGNLSALALEPLGHMAGMAATVYGALSTLIALPLGMLIGQSFDMSVVPLATGFAVLTGLALAAMAVIERRMASDL